MGREIRMVPADWQHPKDDDGRYIPLHDNYNSDAQRWDEEVAMWAKGMRRDYGTDGWKPIEAEYAEWPLEDWGGKRPRPEDYMPQWKPEERTHLMMYENTSEGTPISPAFSAPEELARWLADNNASAFGGMTATYEQWLATCNSGWAPSAVIDGGVFRSGVAAMAKTE